MKTSEAIETRRAVSAFDPEYRIASDETETLLSLALLSPTAFNIQHWRFVLVEDPELRKQIRAIAWNQPQVTDASLFILVTADTRAWEKAPERYWAGVDEQTRSMILGAMEGFYGGHEDVARDEALRSGAMAAQTLMLAARARGYESCPMVGYDATAMAELVRLPEDHLIVMAVAIGKGIAPPKPRQGKLSLAEVVVKNRFA